MTSVSGPAWPALFDDIRAEFGYSVQADQESAQWLAHRLVQPPFRPADVLARARSQAEGRTVWVVGAADRARADLDRVPKGAVIWAADGATSAVLEAGRTPRTIVTDLDGKVEDEVTASQEGSFVIVHAHGDNRPALERWLASFPPARVAGTCQVPAPPPLVNPGGFTDGDRAVHLALYLGAREVRLVGFDFDSGPGRYSGRYDAVIKQRKLAWARRIIESLAASGAPVRPG